MKRNVTQGGVNPSAAILPAYCAESLPVPLAPGRRCRAQSFVSKPGDTTEGFARKAYYEEAWTWILVSCGRRILSAVTLAFG